MVRTYVRYVVCVLLVLTALLVLASPANPQFTPFSKRHSNAILEGNWQSCLIGDKGYSERVYDHMLNGIGQFEVHLGPQWEFAIFTGVQEEHRPHNDQANLLQPFVVLFENNRARHKWEIPSLALGFQVILAGGSDPNCRSWQILLEPIPATSR